MSLEPKVYIVGAGPGDPDLITVKGLRILQETDVVVYTDSLVSQDLVTRAKADARIVPSAGMTLEEIIQTMVTHVRRGESVVRLHTGDPAVFGATFEQMALLRKKGVPFEVVPGVSSVFASAAVLGVELTIPELTQTVIFTRAEGRTPVPEKERLAELARHHTTIALFLSATLAKKVTHELITAGWSEETPVAVVQRATWPDQKVVRTTLGRLDQDMREAGIRNHAMILAGWALDTDLEEKGTFRSKLYDKTFTHSYRKGVKQP
ncbi:cobalt-precorrin-4 C(11)-methyltransferase [Polycladomyces abyssicola]|uniref:uroporphyrinogen-III C-methyltransferase n=1 Tax=Polycladomyces abyssicola TaxID=1125966 RepID=A0A8D5ZLD3_9BACL|nr:precorrin-4 C(11)-methyltransferase [Polycladomyces abyssicola]BCU80520.1 cobalt-precorrin-4 C(11)-methyltransferase [Polycladomyces abyssicola]